MPWAGDVFFASMQRRAAGFMPAVCAQPAGMNPVARQVSNIVYLMPISPPIIGGFLPSDAEKHNKISQNRLTAIVNAFILTI
jgi:hypothetical protein